MRLALILILIFTSMVVAASPPTTQRRPSQTVSAQREISIIWSRQDPDFTRRALARLRSLETVDAVVTQVLGIAPNSDFHPAKIVEQQTQQGVTTLGISVMEEPAPPGTPMMASEIADALVVRVREILAEEARGSLEKQLKVQMETRDVAAQSLASAEKAIDELRKELRSATGRVDVTPADVRREISSLEEQRQQATLALEQKQVRAEALAASLAKLSAEAEQRGKDDPVAAELQKVVAAKREAKQRLIMLSKQGTVSTAEVSQAEAAEAEANAKLLERRQSIATSIAGDALPAWNRELLSLGIERAELEARVKLLSDRLDRLSSVVDKLDRFESLTRERDLGRDDVANIEKTLRALNQRISTMVLPEAFVESATQTEVSGHEERRPTSPQSPPP